MKVANFLPKLIKISPNDFLDGKLGCRREWGHFLVFESADHAAATATMAGSSDEIGGAG